MRDSQYGTSPAAINLVKILHARRDLKQRAKVTNFLAHQGELRNAYKKLENTALAPLTKRWLSRNIQECQLKLDPVIKTHMQNVAIGMLRELK